MILRALFLRPIRRAPLRFLVTVVGVAAGVAAVVATLASSRAAVAALQEGVAELSGRAVLEVRAPGGLADSVLGDLVPLAHAAILVPIVEEVALSPRTRTPVRLFGVDAFVDASVRGVAPAFAARAGNEDDDHFLEFVRGDGAWIGAGLARDLSLERGGTLELDVRARPVALRVLGVLPSGRGAAFDHLVLVDVALAQELVGRIGRLDRIEIVPRVAGADLDELRERALALVPRGAAVVAPAQRGADARGLVRSLEFNLTALSGISLFVGAVLVATTLATSVVQRARTLALLRSLGASAGQVRVAILVEAGTIGVLGGVAGTALGFVGARTLLPQMRATVATVLPAAPQSAIRFAWDHAATGVLLGVAVALLAAWLPVVEGARTPPIQALRGEAPARLSQRERRIALGVAGFFALMAVELVQLPAWDGLPVAALLGTLCCLGVLFAVLGPAVDALGALAGRVSRLPVSLRLACAALASGRRRAAWAAGAVGVAVTLSISIAAMVHSFRQTVIAWSDQSLRADFTIRPLTTRDGLPIGRLDPEVLAVAERVVGAQALDPYHAVEALHAGESVTVTAADFGLAARRGGPQLTDRTDPLAAIARAHAARGALVNEAFARRFDVEQGDRIRLEVGGHALERRIEGVFRDYGDSRGIVTIERDDFLSYFPNDAPRQVSVHLLDDADRAALRTALESALAARFQVEVLSNVELRTQVLSVFDRTFAITTALQGVSALVAVIAVLSVLYALVAERRADLATIAAVGGDRLQLAAVVVGQAAGLGLLGAATGALTGVVVGVILVSVVNVQSFGWTIDFHQPWRLLATTVGGVVLACAVAGLLPARATDPRRLADALREEAA